MSPALVLSFFVAFSPAQADETRVASDSPPKSRELFELLKTSALKPESSSTKRRKEYRAYDVLCEIRKAGSEAHCTLRNRPKGTTGSRVHQLRKADSQTLFEILSEMPISKGEGGVMTPFISCSRTEEGKSVYNDCSVAIQIDYRGP